MEACPVGGIEDLPDVVGLGVLTRLFSRDLVDEVLALTGRRERRSRALPARMMVYLVLALCLFTSDAYEEVVRKLTHGLVGLRMWRSEWQVPSSSAVSQARSRLGAEPLAALFARVCVPLAGPGTPGAHYAGRRVMAIDGVVLDVPDTPENLAAFGKHANGADRSSAFPQVRMVTLTECGTHAAVAAAFDAVGTSERELTGKLTSQFEAGMLVLADRGFFSYDMWCAAREAGADLLWRMKRDYDLPVLEWLPDGSYLSEMVPRLLKQRIKQRGHPERADAVRVPVRVVEYMVTGRGPTETIVLITTLTDPGQSPAAELAALYSQRWEHESAFDEIETHQMHPGRVLRSRTPELVRQEIWALLMTHYAVRAFIVEAADDSGEDPDRYSFIRTIRVIRRQVIDQAAFSPLPAERGPGSDES